MKNIFFLFLGLALFQGCAAHKTVRSPYFSNDNGAIKGYDPVAYFTQGQPVKGAQNIAHAWQGTTWHFANAENKAAFVQNPEKYAPQYGGYCAYGWADGDGHAAPTEPDAWKIVGGKLYLNYNKDVQASWAEDIPGSIKKADTNYQKQKQ